MKKGINKSILFYIASVLFFMIFSYTTCEATSDFPTIQAGNYLSSVLFSFFL